MKAMMTTGQNFGRGMALDKQTFKTAIDNSHQLP
jgi:hypothetical protein